MVKSNKKVPLRRCVGCGEMKNKKEMIRVIRTNENEFCLDVSGKKNGRGAYLCDSPSCLQAAIKNRGLEKSFKQSIPEDVYQRLEGEMTNIEE